MWLPKPVYERMPIIWLLLGLLFLAGSLYIGLGDMIIRTYVAIGFACIAFGAMILFIRSKHRQNSSLRDNSSS